MKRLNQKGFAMAGVLYTLLIIFLGIIFYFLMMLSNRKNILDNIKENVYKDISGIMAEELTISFGQIPNLMVAGSSYNLKENYVNTSNKQANITCTANDVEIENTSILTPGNYTLACTIELGNMSDHVEKEVAVIEKGTHIYYNPVTNKVCEDYTIENSKTGVNTGCMKWYIYADSDANRFNMILDHNTTASVAWNSSGVNTNGMKEVQTKLTEDTAGWNKSLNARIITADEIAKITGADNALAWNSSKNNVSTPVIGTSISYFYLDGASGSDSLWQTQVVSGTGTSKYAWLYDYTSNCTNNGCNIADSQTDGYWTSNPIFGTGYENYAWDIDGDGALGGYMIDTANRGIRPVITVNKSDTNILCDASSNRVCKYYNATNLFENGSFENGFTGWNSNLYGKGGGSLSTARSSTGVNSVYINAVNANEKAIAYINNSIVLNANHAYYFAMEGYVSSYTSGSNNPFAALVNFGRHLFFNPTVLNKWQRVSDIILPTSNVTNSDIRFGQVYASEAIYQAYFDDIILIDLTETFGSGNEPSKEWCDKNIKWFNGSKEIFW